MTIKSTAVSSPKRNSTHRPNVGLYMILAAALTWKVSFFIHSRGEVLQTTHSQPTGVFLDGWKQRSRQTTAQLRIFGSKAPNVQKPGVLGRSNAEKSQLVDSGKETVEKATTVEKEVELYTGPSRTWEQLEGGFPCHPGEKQLMVTSPPHDGRGFFFHRPMKVGSTTMVGVVLRLAHNRSPWLKGKGIKCQHRSMHGSALEMEYGKRDKRKSFLFSLIRHPTKRAISEFFHFVVSSYQVEPTDNNFKRHLNSPHMKHHYLYDLSARNYTMNITQKLNQTFHRKYKQRLTNIMRRRDARGKNHMDILQKEFLRFGSNNPNVTQIVEDILEDYDFIAITERMDESLVAMQMLLNLTTKDILYTKARSSGGWSNGRGKRPCIFIPPSYVSPGMKEYFESPAWHKLMKGDFLLYNAASASLDRTIEKLGRKEFQRNLQALKRGLKLAEANCKGRVTTLCSEGGERIPFENNSCYVWGEACDHECINEIEL